ncbi:hypothetical protein ACQ856_18260 [Mycolicibacterium psychrotolerans]|uniref:hypothetical protein n=1 Tax=Mycolicibacterium psychrotolerans TaxID=216929 RepID=UPI003D672C16
MARHNARNTDPTTSHRAAAARRAARASQCQRLLEAFAAAGRDGYTDHEAAQHAALDELHAGWWKRASDLRAAGLIEWRTSRSDGSRMLRRGDNGLDVGVSVITAAGRESLRGAA